MGRERELPEKVRLDIVRLYERGVSMREITRKVNCHHTIVIHLINKLKIDGIISSRKRSGRPHKTTVYDERLIIRETKKRNRKYQQSRLQKITMFVTKLSEMYLTVMAIPEEKSGTKEYLKTSCVTSGLWLFPPSSRIMTGYDPRSI